MWRYSRGLLLCVQTFPFFQINLHMFCFLYISLTKAVSKKEMMRGFSIKYCVSTCSPPCSGTAEIMMNIIPCKSSNKLLKL